MVDEINLGGGGADGLHLMVLRQQNGQRQAYIANPCNCYFHDVLPFVNDVILNGDGQVRACRCSASRVHGSSGRSRGLCGESM